MNNEIGEAAGLIWSVLSSSGDATITSLRKETGKDAFMVNAAIGWLAREGKIELKKSGRSVKISLRQEDFSS